MNKAWLTYCWDDNKTGDVDYCAQQLTDAGIEVKLDRWTIGSGRRLWEQIEQFIQDPVQSDAWMIYATEKSLKSQPCAEELAYALDRALNSRGVAFPMIGIFNSRVDNSLIPAAIKTRLYVSTADPDWTERVVAACEGRSALIPRPRIEPYEIMIHPPSAASGGKHSIEVRPRAGSWAPFFAGVPIAEKGDVSLSLAFGPRGTVPAMWTLFNCGSTKSEDGNWWLEISGNECTPTQSYFIHCDQLPSTLVFGVLGGKEQFSVSPR